MTETAPYRVSALQGKYEGIEDDVHHRVIDGTGKLQVGGYRPRCIIVHVVIVEMRKLSEEEPPLTFSDPTDDDDNAVIIGCCSTQEKGRSFTWLPIVIIGILMPPSIEDHRYLPLCAIQALCLSEGNRNAYSTSGSRRHSRLWLCVVLTIRLGP